MYIIITMENLLVLQLQDEEQTKPNYLDSVLNFLIRYHNRLLCKKKHRGYHSLPKPGQAQIHL